MAHEKCPINNTLQYIGKKWSLLIIRDLFFGKKRFTEFLEANPKLSSKVLSQRLKELEKHGLITKHVTNNTPIEITYKLTNKGKNLNKLLYEIAQFSMHDYKEDLEHKTCTQQASKELKKALNIQTQ